VSNSPIAYGVSLVALLLVLVDIYIYHCIAESVGFKLSGHEVQGSDSEGWMQGGSLRSQYRLFLMALQPLLLDVISVMPPFPSHIFGTDEGKHQSTGMVGGY